MRSWGTLGSRVSVSTMTWAVIWTASSTTRDQLSAVIHSVVWGPKTNFISWSTTQDPDAFARSGAIYYAQHADLIVAEHEVPSGHRVGVKR